MIVIIGAMPEELKEIELKDDVILVETGIGKVNAAMKLTEAINKYEVTEIYNFGLAGASSHYEVGDIVLIKDAMYHDFDLTFFGYEKGQVPNCPVAFQSDKDLVDKVKKVLPYVKESTLFTGDYFMTEAVSVPYICDMEGTALYQVAHHYQIPLVSVKVVSDIVGMDEHYDNYKKFETSEGATLINDIYQKIFK